MCGTTPTAFSAYSAYTARSAPVGTASAALPRWAGKGAPRRGQPDQAMPVSANEMAPRPSQVCIRPWRSSSGTSEPESTMPTPMPMKIAPLARPRRAGAMCGSTVGAASTISVPPERPARKRQAKNHRKSTGQAQASSEAVVSSIMARSRAGAEMRAAIGVASRAPAR